MTGAAVALTPEQRMARNVRLDVRDLRSKIGRNIMNMRRIRRMRLSVLSKTTGISVGRLDDWEFGKREIDLLNLVRIASALDVQPGALVGTYGEDGAKRETLYQMTEFLRKLHESGNYDFSLPFDERV